MNTRLTIRTGVLLAAVSSMPLLGHHSVAGAYDSGKPTTIVGTVTEIKWQNPHVSLVIDLKGADGKISTWQVEIASPNALMRMGFRKETVVVSSQVRMEVWPARDGSLNATGRMLILPDGMKVDVHDSFGDSVPVK